MRSTRTTSPTLMAEGYNDAVIVTSPAWALRHLPVMDYDGDGMASTGTTYLQLSQDEKGPGWKFSAQRSMREDHRAHQPPPAVELGEIEREEYGVDACLWIGTRRGRPGGRGPGPDRGGLPLAAGWRHLRHSVCPYHALLLQQRHDNIAPTWPTSSPAPAIHSQLRLLPV